jgi:hypothetical protein
MDGTYAPLLWMAPMHHSNGWHPAVDAAQVTVDVGLIVLFCRRYVERNLPLDVYVTDMNWHKKDNWGGWTFDQHLYPYVVIPQSLDPDVLGTIYFSPCLVPSRAIVNRTYCLVPRTDDTPRCWGD